MNRCHAIQDKKKKLKNKSLPPFKSKSNHFLTDIN